MTAAWNGIGAYKAVAVGIFMLGASIAGGMLAAPAQAYACDTGYHEVAVPNTDETSCVKDASAPAANASDAQASASASQDQPSWLTGGLTIGFAALLSPVAIFAWLVFKIGGFLLGLAGTLFNFTVGVLVFGFAKYLGNSPGMLAGWGVLRDFGNIVLLFGFVFLGISTILDLHSYPWKKTLPMLVIFAVLLNFSLFAAEAVVDGTNVLAAALYNATYSTGGTCNAENGLQCFVDTGIAGDVLARLDITSVYNNQGSQSAIGAIATFAGNVAQYFGNPLPYILQFIGLALVVTIAAVVLFAGAVMLLSRAIILAFLMVTSPIGFAGMAIPGLNKLAQDWWHKLINQALFAPVFILLLLVSLKMTDGLNQIVGPGQGLATAISATGSINTGPLLLFALIIGFMIGSLMLAQKFGIYGADIATSFAGRAVYGSMAFAGRRTIGRYAYNQAEKMKGSKFYREGLGRFAYGGMKWAAGGNYDLRSSTAGKTLKNLSNVDIGHPQHGGFEHTAHDEAEKLRKIGEDAENTPEEKLRKAQAKSAAEAATAAATAAQAKLSQHDKEAQARQPLQNAEAAEIAGMRKQADADSDKRQAAIAAQEQVVQDLARGVAADPAGAGPAYGDAVSKLDELKKIEARETDIANKLVSQRQEALEAEKKFYADQRNAFQQQADAANATAKERVQAATNLTKELDPQRLFADALQKELRDNKLLRVTAAPEVYEHARHKLNKYADMDATERGFEKLSRAMKEQAEASFRGTKGIERELKKEFDQTHDHSSDDQIAHGAHAGH